MAVLAVAACARQSEPRAFEVVQVAFQPLLSYAPLAIAVENGYFREAGIDARLVSLRPDAALMALASNQIDVLTGPVGVGLFHAIGRGQRVAIVADKGYEAPEGCGADALIIRSAVLRPGATLTADIMLGLKVSVVKSSPNEYLLDRYLQPLHLTVGDLQTVSIPFDSLIPALSSGAVDLRIAGEPVVTQAVRSGAGSVLVRVNQFTPGFQAAVLAFGPHLLSDRGLGQRFITAYLRGVQEYERGKTARNLSVIGHFTSLDRDILQRACWPEFHRDGSIDTDSLTAFQRWAVRRGYLQSEVPPSLFWDGSFVAAAHQPELR